MNKVRWYHLLVLGGLIAAGAWLRFDRLAADSLWLDEYWSVYVATGRDQIGNGLLEIPSGVVLDPPPAMGFDHAPPWWHVWTGVASAGNWPPIYGIVLRWWIDLFGPGDFATRTLSVLLSLASAVLFFDILRRDQGPWPALLGSSMMSLAVFAVGFGREVRPYSMITFLSLCITWIIFAIKRDGPAFWRLIVLALLAFSLVLTHYFSLGPLVGIAIFALWRLPRDARRRVLASLAIAGLVTLIVWGPTFAKLLPRMNYMSSWLKAPPASPADYESMSILTAPGRLLSGSMREILNSSVAHYGNWAIIVFDIILFAPLALIVYAWPIRMRKTGRDDILYWWLWTVGSIGLVVAVDLYQHYRSLSYPRFPFIAFPGVCALVCAYAGSKGRMRAIAVALVIAFCLLVRGPAYSDGVPPRRPWREAAASIQTIAAPGDILAFDTFGQELWPVLGYCVYSHYAPSDRHPIILPPVDNSELKVLAAEGRTIWVVGHDAPYYTQLHFPGWRVVNLQHLAGDLYIWRVTPPPL